MRGKSQWKGKEAAVPTGGEQVTADHQGTGGGGLCRSSEGRVRSKSTPLTLKAPKCGFSPGELYISLLDDKVWRAGVIMN